MESICAYSYQESCFGCWAVWGIQQDGISGRRHPSLWKHWWPLWHEGWIFLRGYGLLLRKDMESHSAVQDRILPAVAGQGIMAHRIRAAAFSILQRWNVCVWAQSSHLQLPFRNSHGSCADALRRTGLVLLSILRSWYSVGWPDLILTNMWCMFCRISWTCFLRRYTNPFQWCTIWFWPWCGNIRRTWTWTESKLFTIVRL